MPTDNDKARQNNETMALARFIENNIADDKQLTLCVDGIRNFIMMDMTGPPNFDQLDLALNRILGKLKQTILFEIRDSADK